MMRLTNVLRGRDTTTTAELASELGVSRRTLLRDLATLRQHGLPITGEAGPGGGVRLEGGRGVAAVHLSVSEIVALWLGARLSRGASDLPWGHAAGSALTKLLASLPAPKAQTLRALSRRVIVGPPASATVIASSGSPPAELLTLFETAFSNGLGLGFHYINRSGRQSTRRIEPHGLLVEPPVWYILARDLDAEEPRTFRMDRIGRPRLLRDASFRPDFSVIESQLPEKNRWHPLTGR